MRPSCSSACGAWAAAEGSELGAGDVDEHAGEEESVGWSRAVHRDGGVGVSGALAEALEAGEVDVGGVDAAVGADVGGEGEALASGAGAEVEHGVAGLGAQELGEELARFVLDLEEAVEPEAEEVGPGGGDVEPIAGPSGGRGGDAAGGEELAELVAGGAQGVGAEGDGAGEREGGGELGSGGGVELEEDVGQPVGDGGEVAEVGGGGGRREGEVQQGLGAGKVGEVAEERAEELEWGG